MRSPAPCQKSSNATTRTETKPQPLTTTKTTTTRCHLNKRATNNNTGIRIHKHHQPSLLPAKQLPTPAPGTCPCSCATASMCHTWMIKAEQTVISEFHNDFATSQQKCNPKLVNNRNSSSTFSHGWTSYHALIKRATQTFQATCFSSSCASLSQHDGNGASHQLNDFTERQPYNSTLTLPPWQPSFANKNGSWFLYYI